MADWNKRFIELTKHIAQWSKDKTKVGAVIVDEDNRIISTGYNGLPQNCNDNDETRHIKPKKLSFVVHAEINAIFSCAKAGIKTKGCTMYLTWYPCCDCAKAIIQSGIKKIVCYEPDWKDDSWGQSFLYANEMFGETNINVVYYNEKKDIVYAEDEAAKMMKVPIVELPKEAAAYLNYMLIRFGNKIGINIASYTHYCQAVLKMPCRDEDNKIDSIGSQWFIDKGVHH
jgi:dCMP deaminase